MYTALYRKWRPMTFDDVVSQPHITSTLVNQLKEGKTAHAYLFTGSRGTGKTTCARIFAKAVNCLNPKDGRPCLECEICKEADNGTLADIIEIDAASNTGVEDIRELRESTIYTPERCRYKIYIIDEVHMLSNQAFNALLKIMEEPPEHIKFILATTEIHKVPMTIVSRCQRYDFRRIRQEDIVSRLMYIAGQEGVSLDKDAASMIARISDGAMRDALSILDQCIAFSDNITQDTVSEAAGIAGRDLVLSLLESLVGSDTAGALRIINELYSKSKDMPRLCDELIGHLRSIMLIKSAPESRELLYCLPDEAVKLEKMAESMSMERIFYQLDCLKDCSEVMQRSSSKRTDLEMCAVKICCFVESSVAKSGSRALSSQERALEARLSELERRLDSLSHGEKSHNARGVSPDREPSAQKIKYEPGEAPRSSPTPSANRVRQPFKEWEMVLERLTEVNPGCAGALKGSQAVIIDNSLCIEVESEFFLSLFKKPENASSLRAVVKEITGSSYQIKARYAKQNQPLPAGQDDRLSMLLENARKENIPVKTD